jgi:hypothetical protein
MIKKFNIFNESKSNFYDILPYDRGELIELIKSEFGEDSSDEVDIYINQLKDLYKNGGEVYRLVFLDNKRDLDKDLGTHWVMDVGVFDRFYSSLDNGDGRKPYLITGYIKPKQVDLNSSVDTFINLPHENEINLMSVPKKFYMVRYKRE